MGDFTDNTIFGSDAAIFICREGLIESFPLLDGKRRWVVKTDEYIPSVDRREIEKRVASRIGHDLGEVENIMLSSFGVQKRISKPIVKNRVLLAGDSAHIVSPIGGQGMNLGWLGAWDLAECLRQIFEEDQSPEKVLEGFENRRIKAARNAIRRAEINMRLGRKSNLPAIRNSIVWLMLNTPLSNLMARIFTMRGVGRWII
jgi:2-polyprenyl-6-methoxyphenol hydroxylase-like FAD-dependent oxidoreductase